MGDGTRSTFAVLLVLGTASFASTEAHAEPTPQETIAAPVSPASPVTGAGLDLRWSGYLQAEGQLYDRASEDEIDPSRESATGGTFNETRFLIRRARLRLDLDHGHVAAALELDGNTHHGPSAGLIDAEVTLRARPRDAAAVAWNDPWAELSIGLLRTPWGFEVGQRDPERFFFERSSASRALFPGIYDVGLRLKAGWRFVRLQIALVNGEPLGVRAFPGQDPNRAKDLVGRLGVAGRRGLWGFSAGVSGLSGRGFHPGTPASKDTLVWRDQNEDGLVQQSEIQILAGGAATPSQSFDRFALGADLHVMASWPRLGTTDLFAEAMWATNLDRALVPADPVSTGRDLRERGFVVGASHELGYHLGLGLRFDRYDPDADAAEQRALAVVPVDLTVTTWTATLAWRFQGLDRVALEYQHQQNAFGRSPSGAPTTLGGAALALRGQAAW